MYPLRIKVRHTVSNLIDRGQLFRKWEKEKKRKKKENRVSKRKKSEIQGEKLRNVYYFGRNLATM